MSNQNNRPSERTPLLSDLRSPTTPTSINGTPPGQRSSLDNVEQTLQLTGPHADAFDAETISTTVRSLTTSEELRASLKLLLCLRHAERLQERKTGISSVQRQTLKKELEVAEKLRDETYDQLYENAENFVEGALWSTFPKSEDGKEEVSVMDMLFKQNTCTELSTHHRITESLVKAWENGLTLTSSRVLGPIERVHRLATPRTLHAIELATHITYLGILIAYIFHPHGDHSSPEPTPPVDPQHRSISPFKDWRVSTILIYSLSRFLQPNSYYSGTSLIVFACFFVHVLQGTTPGTNDTAYVILLLVLAAQLFELHSTRPPSPVLLLYRTRALPISRLIDTIGLEAWAPAAMFFSPMLYVLFVLLSAAAADTFSFIPNITLMATSIVSTTIEPAPGLARVFFAVLIVIVLISIILYSAAMTMLLPSFPWKRRPTNPWDVYGDTIAFQSRQALYSVIKVYSSPLYFPAPLNMLRLAFVDAPVKVLSVLRQKEAAQWVKGTITPALWAVFVLPFIFLFSWLWPLGSARLLMSQVPTRSTRDDS